MRRFGPGATTFRRAAAPVIVLAIAGACGSGSATPDTVTHARVESRPQAAPKPAIWFAQSATLHFGAGRQRWAFWMHEPQGVILLYRIQVAAGTRVRATSQLPRLTVPLLIATSRVGPSSSCHGRAARITCTVREEWCPMPAGTWQIRLHKLAGPAGAVTIWFRVGTPPAQQGA
jgi:hypothetical protein